jgi:hypothetical protein
VKLGTDPLRLTVESCKKQNIEIFFTLRMNDIHDNWTPQWFPQWKKERPQALIGKRSDLDDYEWSDMRSIWSPVDFAYPEVRQRTVEIVRDVVSRYDVDGIDLDYLRHQCYFREIQRGQPATQEHLDMLTDMMRQIRNVVREAGEVKGKPIMLSARVMPNFALNRQFGFDVQKWADSGYIDFISLGGGYDPFTMPIRDAVNWCHQRGMPVYACLSGSGMEERDVKGTYLGQSTYEVEAYRGAASNAWAQGVDGIMTFNVFPDGKGGEQTEMARRIWNAICDPAKMVGQNKLFCIDNVGWTTERGYMFNSVPVDGRLPATVTRGQVSSRVLPVGDDLPALKDRIESLYVRVCFPALQTDDQLDITLNGAPLALNPENPGWLAANIKADLIRRGDNVITVRYISGSSAELTWGAAEMLVTYKP